MNRLSETAAWLDALYGKCKSEDGDLVIVSSNRRKVVKSLPVGSLVAAAKAMQKAPGCYLKINLMDYAAMRSRSKYAVGGITEVKSIVSVHLDVDAGKSNKYVTRRHALWAMESMPKPPTLVVNSGGSDGGFHAYWILKRAVAVQGIQSRVQKNLENWNSRLKELCGGKLDKTCNLDRILRCVGVPREDGLEVVCEYYEPSREYDLDELVV